MPRMNIEAIIQCPDCGYTGTLDSYEVLGCDRDNVMCPECVAEFKPKEQKVQPVLGKVTE